MELDGPEHRGTGKFADGRHRGSGLLAAGYHVLRITDAQVAADLGLAIQKTRAMVRFSRGRHHAMADDLSPTQAFALRSPPTRQGRAPGAEVEPKADRDAPVAKGSVDVAAESAAVTDSGWRWASEHFDAALPAAQATLGLMLGLLGAHLEASGEALAEFIGAAPPTPEPPPEPAGSSVPQVEAEPKALSRAKAPPKPKAADLRAMIEDAYLRASGGARSEPVRLSRLRAELGSLDRGTVDAGLARILRARKETASLGQISDEAIDEAEREAAFSPAGNPLHLIWIR